MSESRVTLFSPEFMNGLVWFSPEFMNSLVWFMNGLVVQPFCCYIRFIREVEGEDTVNVLEGEVEDTVVEADVTEVWGSPKNAV